MNDVYLITCELLCVGGPGKRKRGVVVGLKTRDMVRLTKSRIHVDWDEKYKMPADRDVGNQLSHDIGMKVKDNVPMLASVYGDLDPMHKEIVYSYVAVSVQFFKCSTFQPILLLSIYGLSMLCWKRIGLC